MPDKEMIERCVNAAKRYSEDKPTYDFSHTELVIEIIKAMREPTEPVLMKVSEAILACPNASDYERLVSVKAVKAFIDAVIND